MNNVIAFTKVDLPYGWLGNMYGVYVDYENNRFRTNEALFQYLRFEGFQDVQKEILLEKSPMAVKMKSKRLLKELKPGFVHADEEDINRMRLCLRLKIDTHDFLKKKLIETGDKIIIEDCGKRRGGTGRIWGAYYESASDSWIGRNELGKLWMELRSEIRQSTNLVS